MKGHFVNPSWESSSFGRDESIIDRVPMGDLKKNYDKMTKMDHEFGLMWLNAHTHFMIFESITVP